MKMKWMILSIMLLSSLHLLAQDEEYSDKKGFDKSRLFFGGNFGASFGDYTFVNITPQLGYRFSDLFSAGAGVIFILSSIKYRDYNNAAQFKDTYGYAGLNIFGRLYPVNFAFLQAQPELNYAWGERKFYDGTANYKLDKAFVPSLLLGAGAAIPTGKGAFMATLQYDVVQDARSPYGVKPFLSFGYSMGF